MSIMEVREQRKKELVEDWERAMHLLRIMATKADLPIPTVVFHPGWRSALNHALPLDRQPNLSGGQYAGVSVTFGFVENCLVIKPH